MSFEDEITSMKAAIEKLVSATLSSIRNKVSGNRDFVLVDTDGNFKNFFLETAKNKIDYAYNEYLLQAKFKSLVDTSNDQSAAETQKMLKVSSELQKGPTMHSFSDIQQVSNSPSVDISAIEKNNQLQLQNELENSLYIIGLPLRNDNAKSLLGLFQILCNHLLVPMDAEDIESIQSDGYALTVTFHTQHKMKKVKCTYERRKNLKSDQVLQLLPGEISAPVKIHHKLTEFYRQLTRVAQSYVRKKQIYCHRTNGKGLGIMFHRDSKLVYVQSQYELHETIYRYELKRKSKNS